ncbi:MAG: AtpZ/AtpI family protein [candidate division KSB1 bacterium]|nr:AtpZ/AtpI family protein [candidate division KSB1 bacterium]
MTGGEQEDLKRRLRALREAENSLRKNLPASQPESKITALRYSWLGFEFAATVIAFAFLGHWLDGVLASKPWFLLLGFCCGFAVALYRLVLSARKLG